MSGFAFIIMRVSYAIFHLSYPIVRVSYPIVYHVKVNGAGTLSNHTFVPFYHMDTFYSDNKLGAQRFIKFKDV